MRRLPAQRFRLNERESLGYAAGRERQFGIMMGYQRMYNVTEKTDVCCSISELGYLCLEVSFKARVTMNFS